MLICVKTSAQDTRERSFWAPNNVFGRQFVPKPGHRVLVIGDFRRNLVSARVRRLLVIGIFRARLIAYTARKLYFLPKPALKCLELPGTYTLR